jgi:AraC-like DNA-binding protein
MELNLIINAKGAKRMVGDHVGEIDEVELVLVGANLPHVWRTHNCKSRKIQEITIQFHKDLFEEKMLKRNQLHFIREMFEKSSRGILFSPTTTQQVISRLKKLRSKQGFDSVLELMSIFHDLSTSRNLQLLSEANFSNVQPTYKSRRIEKVMEYMRQNFDKSIDLSDVSKIANMTEVSFSRFMKTQTGIGFIDSLLDIRLAHASRLLIDTNQPISEIAYNCGFNNISNFNRLFKKKKGCTPKQLRENYTNENRVFI